MSDWRTARLSGWRTAWLRRRLAAAAALLALLAARPVGADDDNPDDDNNRAAFGYDHVGHEGRVAAAGAAPIACDHCHALAPTGLLVGRPDHRACFGACHGPAPGPRRPAAPYPIAHARLRVCGACHAPGALTAAIRGTRDPLGTSYPPYDNDPDFGLALSHAAHAAPTRDRGGCTACHAVPPEPGAPAKHARRSAHARCAACHNRLAAQVAPMTACGTCHIAGTGRMAAPHRTDTAHPVRASFSHSRHLARGDGGCGPCHDAVQTTADNEVPPPTMATCADCHDGDKAFSVVTAECRRCHTEPPPREPYRKPLGPRFSHRLHADRGMALACDACHRLDPQGRPLPPAPNHAPCSNAGCHRDQFFAAKPRICGACHLGTEPWRPLHRDRPSRPNTEFGARFSHRQHRVAQTANAPNLPAAARGPGLPCTRCHGDMDSRWRSRVPGEHTSCSGDGCHALTGGPAPALTACDDCHVAGLRATRAADRAATRASVRAAFDHAQHRTTPGAQPRPVPCVRCHASVADADTIAVPTPAKDTCIGCHDGRAAFKLTGHGCARCHRPASRGR